MKRINKKLKKDLEDYFKYKDERINFMYKNMFNISLTNNIVITNEDRDFLEGYVIFENEFLKMKFEFSADWSGDCIEIEYPKIEIKKNYNLSEEREEELVENFNQIIENKVNLYIREVEYYYSDLSKFLEDRGYNVEMEEDYFIVSDNDISFNLYYYANSIEEVDFEEE